MAEKTSLRRVARRFDLLIVSPVKLTLRRKGRGYGFSYETEDGNVLTDPETLARLRRLAVPPAYRNVRFAVDPRAHLQAIGQDAAGRLQYRYHPDWTLVRETLKADRLSSLAEALPRIMRCVRRELRRPSSHRRFTLSAVVQLVALTAIRAGSEEYAQEHGTRGATTLLKSHVHLTGDEVALAFTGKGGKKVRKQCRDPDLSHALAQLKALPGSRLFKFEGEDGALHAVRRSEVNAFLKAISGQSISLKDFRTLVASLGVLDRLGRVEPAGSERGRRRQIREAIAPLADELANTLTVCRTSYVHDSVISAFEAGWLAKARAEARSPHARIKLLSDLLRSNGRRPAARSVAAGNPVFGKKAA